MVLGIVVALFATIIYNAGFVLEKRALSELPPISARRVGRLLRVLGTSPRWLLGFCVLGVGLCCQILALSLIPLSVAQPIQISGLALLVVFSAVFLGERASRREWAGLGVLAASLVLVYLSLEPGRDKVGTRASGWVMATLAIGTVAVGLVVFLIAGRRRRRPASGALYGAAAGLMYGVAGLQAKGMAGFFAQHLNDKTGGFVLQAITSPYPYLLVVMSGAGLVLFQTGLQRGRASIVVPVSNVVGSVYLIMTGTIAFGEPLPQDPMRLTCRIAGFVVATIIVVLLPTHERQAPVVRTKRLASAKR
ncbi:MAG TPA: DMT family transporter [Streptosporangiaceae bacterium]|nr:DMT family transporter [Streptosporangiaceae bacterium]